jgi:hypothetical protein
MSPDNYRDAMGAALLRNSREKLCELVASGSDNEGLRNFIAGLDEHFGSGAIRAVAITAEPGKPASLLKRKPKLRIIKGGKGQVAPCLEEH